MKKLRLVAISLCAMFVAVVGVNAETLTFKNGGLDPDLLKIEDVSKEGEEYQTVKVTVKVNQDTINNVLANKPGYGEEGGVGEASLGIFYIEINPGFTKDGKTLDEYYAYTSDTCDFACAMAKAKTDADAQYATGKHDGYVQIWTTGVEIQYNDNGTWKTIPTKGVGNTSIEKAIRDLINKQEGNLEYGKDFIFSVPEVDIAWVWRIAESDKPVDYKYVRVTYDIEFPITASNGDRSYYYATLEQALEEAEKTGVNEITIYEDTTVAEDVDVPAGVAIKTNGTAKLEFEGNVTLENGATITGTNVSYAEDKAVSYAVTTESNEGGTVKVDKTTAKKGEVVTITVEPEEGYELDKLYLDGEETTELTFDMPEKTVVVKATFKKIVVEEEKADTTELEKAIAEAEKYLDDKKYDAKEVEALKKIIEEAKGLIGTDKEGQETVDAMVEVLKDAMTKVANTGDNIMSVVATGIASLAVIAGGIVLVRKNKFNN